MKNKLLLFTFYALMAACALSGCILHVESAAPSPRYHTDDSPASYASVWVEDFYAECYEDYGDVYDWYFEVYADSHYGPSDVENVEIYINSWKWVGLTPHGYGIWIGSLLNTYFYCDRDYDFEIVATDYYGNTSMRTFYW